MNYIEDTKRWQSHELQALSNNDSNLRWITGLYYYRERATQPFDLRAPEAAPAGTPPQIDFAVTGVCGPFPDLYCGVSSLPGEANPNNNYYHQSGLLFSKSYAAYGQIDYGFADKWNLKVGARYTLDEKEGYEEQSIYLYDPYGEFSFLGAGAGIPFQWVQSTPNDNNRKLSNDWSAFSGVLGLSYEPTDDSLIYGQYTRGYKAGGMRLGQLTEDNPATPQDEELVDALEGGAKGMFFDDRLSLATAVFYYMYDGQQVPVNFTDPSTNISQQLFLNIPESSSLGFELEAAYQPADNFRAGLNYGYLKTEVSKFDGLIENAPAGAFQNPKGNSLPRSPEHSVNLNLTYIHDMSDRGELSFGGDWSYVGEQHTSLFEDPSYVTPSHEISNLRMIWTADDSNLRVIASARNIFDDHTEISVGPGSANDGFSRYESGNGQRTFFVEVQKKF